MLFVLNPIDKFPINTQITVTIDSHLQTLTGGRINDYSWNFHTGNAYIINCRDYLFFPEKSKYLLYQNKEFYPYIEFYGSYTIENKIVSDTGVNFDFDFNKNNYISFLLNDKGLWIIKYMERGYSIDFPSPILFLPYYAEFQKNYETNVNNLIFKSRITQNYEKTLNSDYMREIKVELELPSIYEAVIKVSIFFGYHYGITAINVTAPQFKGLTVEKVLPQLSLLFPCNNQTISQKNPIFIFNRKDYQVTYWSEFSRDTSFNNLYTYFTTNNEIEYNKKIILSAADTYYYRIAAKYADYDNADNTGVYTPSVKLFSNRDTVSIRSTPPKIAFTGKQYLYQAEAVTASNNLSFIYYLTRWNSNLRMHPYNGLINWKVDSNAGDSFVIAYNAVNLETAEYISDSYILKIYSDNILALWENASYKFYFYSDCSMKMYNKLTPSISEINTKFDIINNNIFFYNSTANDTEYLYNYSITGNNLIFTYNGTPQILSKNGVLD